MIRFAASNPVVVPFCVPCGNVRRAFSPISAPVRSQPRVLCVVLGRRVVTGVCYVCSHACPLRLDPKLNRSSVVRCSLLSSHRACVPVSSCSVSGRDARIVGAGCSAQTVGVISTLSIMCIRRGEGSLQAGHRQAIAGALPFTPLPTSRPTPGRVLARHMLPPPLPYAEGWGHGELRLLAPVRVPPTAQREQEPCPVVRPPGRVLARHRAPLHVSRSRHI